MSLTRLALRKATVHALRGVTFAGGNVRDSDNTPIDDAAVGSTVPAIGVYTDEGAAMPRATSLIVPDDHTVSLVIEIGVSTRMEPSDEDIANGVPPHAIGWVTPTTDAGLEYTVDAVERQIVLALMRGEGPWCEMWRSMVPSIKTVKSQRGGGEKGVRFAARQIVMECETFAEPQADPAALAAGTIWRRFLDLCATDADLLVLVPSLEALITGGPALAPWRAVMAAHGLDRARADAMLITPARGSVMAPITDVTVERVTPEVP
jgi:hypothetical protein